MPTPPAGNVADFTWKRVPLPRDMTINRIVTAEGKTFAVGSTPDQRPAIGMLDADGKVTVIVNPAIDLAENSLLPPRYGSINDLVEFKGALIAVGHVDTEQTDRPGARHALPYAAAFRSTDGGRVWQAASIEPRPSRTAQSVNIQRALVSGDTLSLLGTPGFSAYDSVRQGADQCPVYVWTSSDGRGFQTATPFEDCGRTFISAVTGPGGILFVNGDNATRWRRSGREWLPISIASTTPASNPRINDIAGSEHGYVAVGTVRATGDANDIRANPVTGVIWWSADGHEWEQVATTVLPGQPFDAFLTSVAYAPSGWIATGWRSRSEFGRGPDEAIVYTSADGRQWTPSTRDGVAFEQFAEAESVAVTADGFAIRGAAQVAASNGVLWLGSKIDVATGTVEGWMNRIGGPGPVAPVPLAGTVTAKNAGGETRTAKIDAAGGFSIDLAPGRYTIVGRSPSYGSGKDTCGGKPGSVVVRARAVTHVVLTCQID
jgi:hypothetical protein